MKVSLKGVVIAGSMTLLAVASFIDFYLMKPGRLHAPALSGTLVYQSLQHDGRLRRYALYLPANLASGAPLVMALHGAKSDGTGMRLLTGHRLDHLADRYGMAVVYPEGEQRQWSDCRRAGDGKDQREHGAPDDIGFLQALRDDLTMRHGIDAARVHVVGFSDGGQMGLRLALQKPKMVASLSIIGASMPSPGRSLCGPLPRNAPPVLMINGTHDRLNPYRGGVAEMASGSAIKVMPAIDTAAWLAGAGALQEATPPSAQAEDGCRVEHARWRNGNRQVALYTVHGGGHTLPQPYVRYPRRLGHTHDGFDGIAVIGNFLLSHNAPRQPPNTTGCLQC
ncbi:PHB depolymerase family esterase [Pseudoxanthomonas sp. UTMC 1351]|uniref:PHB depolymerase family esterase n=1 Tax=Pseudoxanthomonas sp. UTMC 1351 TaxID=2695853 RepID=UPI0034CDA781